ncbi:MAG: STM3941 family protein [Rudaea sp.]
MIGLRSRLARNPTTADAVVDFNRTIRIEPDRAHLARLLFMGLLAALLLLAGAVWGIAYPGRATPWNIEWRTLTGASHKTAQADVDVFRLKSIQRHSLVTSPWVPIELGIAALLATFGMLRIVYRLQDSDPVLIISPRGVSFKPNLFGEVANIPWVAIRAIKMRKIKHQRRLTFQVDDSNRYVPRSGIALYWPRPNGANANTRAIALNIPTSRRASATIESTLRQYLAHYRPAEKGTTTMQLPRDVARLSGSSARVPDERLAARSRARPAIRHSSRIEG